MREYWLPLSLRIGVSYELFWKLNPRLLKPFIKAREDTLQESNRLENFNAWRLGQYIQSAIGSCLDKKVKYPKMPFGEEAELNDPEKMNEVVEQRAQMFAAQMEIFNQRFKNAEPASQKSGEKVSTQTME